MDRRMTSRWARATGGKRWMGVVAVLVAGVLALAPGAVVGQERTERTECRCVDADGNPIENCTCFVRPDMEALTSVFSFSRPNRARIGVTVSGEQEARFDRDGAHVEGVLEGGPADEAGLREGDVITRVNGRSLFDPLEDQAAEDRLDLDQSVPVQRLLALLGELEPGDEVEVQYLRDGETRTAVIESEENPARFGEALTFFRGGEGPEVVVPPRGGVRGFVMPREGRVLRFEGPEETLLLRMDSLRSREGELRELLSFRMDPCLMRGPGSSTSVYVFGGSCVDGVELRELNPGLGEYFGTQEGVLVIEVREGSTLGLQAGDVLQAIDGREVEDVQHARRILESYRPDEELSLRVVRRGEVVEVRGQRR